MERSRGNDFVSILFQQETVKGGVCRIDTFHHDRFCKCACKLWYSTQRKIEDAGKRMNAKGRHEQGLGASRTQLLDMTLDCSTNGSPADVVNFVEEDMSILQ